MDSCIHSNLEKCKSKNTLIYTMNIYFIKKYINILFHFNPLHTFFIMYVTREPIQKQHILKILKPHVAILFLQ